MSEGRRRLVAIMMTDMVGYTSLTRANETQALAMLEAHRALLRGLFPRYGGLEIKTIGDAFLATFDATSRAVRAATEIVAQARMMGIEVRAGVHTGEVEVRPDDVVGLTVSIAKRVCDLAGPGQVFVSETVKSQLVGSGIAVSEQGSHVLKGVPDEWRLFAIEG